MATDTELDKKELINLGREIDTRIDELRASGRLSDVADASLNEAKVRRDDIQGKLDNAIERGDLLEMLKDEVRRDFNGIRDSITAVDDRLAADAMRTTPDEANEKSN